MFLCILSIFHRICSGEHSNKAENWLTDTETEVVGDLSSQRISELQIPFSDQLIIPEALTYAPFEERFFFIDERPFLLPIHL
jgi:hypothetical protein